MDVVKDWVHVLGSGYEVSVPVEGRVLKSRPVLEVPKCSDTHIFVVFPLSCNSDSSLTHRVYGIEVDGHRCITNEDISKELSKAFDLPSIQQLVLDEATNCFVENLQQTQSCDTTEENRSEYRSACLIAYIDIHCLICLIRIRGYRYEPMIDLGGTHPHLCTQGKS